MAATKRQFNISGVTFTPSGGSATTFTGVTSITTDFGGSLAKFDGDGDRYVTTCINEFNDPSVSINCADMAAAMASMSGVRGTLAYTYKDAKVATGGALTFTVTPAIVASVNANQSHRQFGQSTVTFGVESSDGVTSPISFAFA
jgi:hypothetical protein